MKNAKVYLWNSMMGKVYSASDSFLDNGLAYLKAACEKQGAQVILDDPANMAFMTRFVQGLPGVGELSRRLTLLMPRVFCENPALEDLQAWGRLQDQASQAIDETMEAYLQELALRIKEENCHILGIKVWLGKRHVYAERLAALTAQYSPETLVIAGGPQVNQFQEDCLAGNAFDLGVYSEGENTLAQLAGIVAEKRAEGLGKKEMLAHVVSLARAGDIPNLIYRSGETILKTPNRFASLDNLPLPQYEPDPGKVNIAVVVDDLGCYYQKGCAFCAHKRGVGGHRPRRITPLLAEIEHLLARDIGLFRLSSSATSANKGYKIALKVLSRKIVMEFSMFTRGEANALRRYHELTHQYRTMIQAGLRAVFLGVEAANQRVLDEIVEKGNTVDDLFYTVAAMKEAASQAKTPMDVGLSFIYPLPLPSGMSPQEILDDNLSFLQRLKDRGCHVDSVLVTPAGPIPGSRWFDNPAQYGFDLVDNFVPAFMRYNYELGKDPKTWPDIGIRLGNLSFREMLDECGRFSHRLRQEGYAVNLTDEHCLCARASGYAGREGLMEFKEKSDQAILCLDYAFLNETAAAINAYSKKIARKNSLQPGKNFPAGSGFVK